MHQNMNVLHDAGSDIRWKYFPKMYFLLERLVLPQLSSIFCVREDAASSYRERFPAMRNHIQFTATWVDTEIFQAPSQERRRVSRELMNVEFGFGENEFVLISVGRLDKQKNPLLLVEAFKLLHESMPDVRLLFVGDGILREQIEELARRYHLDDAIRLCGVKPASAICRYLQAADVFVLSSAYEGMPMCVLEALGSGLPVVTTNVGEVSRVVLPQINGELVTIHSAEALANAITRCRENIRQYRGKPCTEAVTNFTPQKVLTPIYENYRDLASRARNVDIGVKASPKRRSSRY
jgi:glycosyltransferase involved in cell wall biosynthesis